MKLLYYNRSGMAVMNACESVIKSARVDDAFCYPYGGE